MRFWFQKKKRPTATFPSFLPVLEEMARSWAELPQAEIDRCEFRMQPSAKGDTKLGVLHNPEARRTWALREAMRARMAEATLYADSRAQSEEERTFYREQAARCSALGDCLKELFWAQAKDDIGGKVWEAETICLRSGWMVVAKETPELPAFLRMLAGGPPM